MVQVCNLGTLEEEVGGPAAHDQPQTHSEFKTRVGCETLSQNYSNIARCSGTCLLSQHLGGRRRLISMSLRPVSSILQVPGQ